MRITAVNKIWKPQPSRSRNKVPNKNYNTSLSRKQSKAWPYILLDSNINSLVLGTWATQHITSKRTSSKRKPLWTESKRIASPSPKTYKRNLNLVKIFLRESTMILMTVQLSYGFKTSIGSIRFLSFNHLWSCCFLKDTPSMFYKLKSLTNCSYRLMYVLQSSYNDLLAKCLKTQKLTTVTKLNVEWLYVKCSSVTLRQN